LHIHENFFLERGRFLREEIVGNRVYKRLFNRVIATRGKGMTTQDAGEGKPSPV
jgi:hypothetical protein